MLDFVHMSSEEESKRDDLTGSMEETVVIMSESTNDFSAEVQKTPLRWLSFFAVAFLLLLLVSLLFPKTSHWVRGVVRHPVPSPNFSDDEGMENQRIDNVVRKTESVDESVNYGSLTSPSEGCARDVPGYPRGRETVVTFISKDNEKRSAVVYVPFTYPMKITNAQPRPVALMLQMHGLNSNCKRFIDRTGFKAHADRDGFVIASLCGSPGFLGTGWNAGTCCGFAGDLPDDVEFAKQVVLQLSKVLCIDQDRVMAVGFSNGAMLSQVLACKAPAVFRAVASVSGVVELRPGNDAGIQACTSAVERASSTARSSVLMIHGTADVVVPWVGNAFLGFPSAEKNLAGWVKRNMCTGDPLNTIKTKSYSNLLYNHCAIGKESISVPYRSRVKGPRCSGRHHDSEWCLSTHRRANTLPGQKTMTKDDVERFFSEVSLEENDIDKKHRNHASKRRHRPDFHDKDDGVPDIVTCKKHGHMKTAAKAKDMKESMWGMVEENPDYLHPHSCFRKKNKHHYPHRKHDKRHRGEHGSAFDKVPVDGFSPPAPQSIIPRERNGASEVEIIRVDGGSHRWPSDAEFSTTDYIYGFGIRIFGRYN